MRFSVILHYSSLLIIGIGVVMLLPLGFSLYYEDSDVDPFLISIGITLTAGILLRQFTIGARGLDINRREAVALVVLSWILVSLFGALPFQFEGTFSSYLDSFFEATSGFTTTGASVLANIESQPHGILLWRNFIQWLGGLGIVALFVSLFPLVGIGAAYLFEAEAAGPEPQKLKVRMRDTAQVIWIIYAGISTLEVILLMVVGKLPVFDSLCHTFGTMATGGFSTKNASVGAYDSLPVNLIIICFMIIAGVNFALYYNLFWHRSLRTFFANTELRVYLLILAVAGVLVTINLLHQGDYPSGRAAEEAVFTTVSMQTTTGFSISDFGSWPTFSQVILLFLMIIGASAGSTSGAIKIVRVIVLAKYAFRQVVLFVYPRAVIPIRLGGRALSEGVISRIVGFFILYMITFSTASLIMTALDLDFVTAISSVATTMGGVGPGLNLIGPAQNFAFISTPGKVVLIACMYLGRLELLTALAVLSPTFWQWR